MMIRQFSLVVAAIFGLGVMAHAEDRKEQANSLIVGVVKAVDTKIGTIQITMKSERMPGDFTFAIGADAKITIDGKAIKLEDLKPGTSITAQLSADQKSVVTIGDAPRRGERPGVEPAVGRTFVGNIKALDLEAGTVTLPLGDGGQERVFKFGPKLKVSMEGKEAKVSDLKVGMRVTLTADETKQLTSIAVGATRREGGDRPARGRETLTELKGIDAKARTVSLPLGDGGVERVFTVSPDAKITIDGKEVKLEDLKPGTKASLKLGEGKVILAITVGGSREK